MTPIEEVLESPLEAVASAAQPVDCLVIGSGTAGVTTALALAERGHRVVILEAGPLMLLEHVGNIGFGGRDRVLPRIHERATYRTRWTDAGGGEGERRAWSLVGGRTVFWSGFAPRFNAWDFADWPLTPGEMAPFYDRAEALMRVSGAGDPARPAYFQGRGQAQAVEALRRAGLAARPASLGVDTQTGRRRPGAGFDSAVARLIASDVFGGFAAGAAVALVAQAAARRLHMDGRQVTGVEVADHRTGRTAMVRARHVVLAGGALQSARLALASGLDRASPQVGRFIGDHLFAQGVARLPAPPAEGEMNILVESTPERPFHLQIQGCFRETWYHPSNSTLWADCQPDGQHVMLAAFGVATMDADNRIELSGPGAGLDAYRVVYRESAQDRATLAAMRRAMAEAAAAMGAAMLRDAVNPPGSALHEIGGLRMSADPRSGVTDPHGRIWALDNLSVADAAAFPSQGSANSYLTITAWSLRHAAALDRALRAG